MMDSRSSPSRMLGFLLFSAAACLASNGALAQLTSCPAGKVCYYVALQPIDVCSSSGAGCAPFNTSSRVGTPGSATATTPIGFVDTATGKDLTRAILNQTGVDIAWSPIRQYNNTSFQSITITQDSNGNLSSPQFLTLSQQPRISQGVAPTSPLNSVPTALNVFFVNTLVPPTPGTLYGFALIGSNGVAISSTTFFPPWPLTPRYDTLAHEITHNLGLNHADEYNYGGTDPSLDLMTAGSTRTTPTSTSNLLNQLGSGDGTGTADQLDTSSTPSTPYNPGSFFQRSEISTSGFLNPIASSTTTATNNSTAAAAAAALAVTTAVTTTAGSNSPKSPNSPLIYFFDTSGPTQGRLGETLVRLVLTLGPAVQFDPPNKVNFLAGTSYVKSSTYNNGKSGDPDCPVTGTDCLVIDLSANGGLPMGGDLNFSQGIRQTPGGGVGGQTPVTPDQLQAAGVTITKKFSDGLVMTSALTGNSGQLSSNSQVPISLAGCPASWCSSVQISAQIDPTVFTQLAGAVPCSKGAQILPGQTLSNGCPDPTKVPPADGDPSTEKQPAAVASCTATGSLSVLVQQSAPPAAVTAYIPNGAWDAPDIGGSGTNYTGVQVVQIEPSVGPPVSIATPHAVNSCASNSVTGQTVCTANTKDVYLLSGTTLTRTLTSGAGPTTEASFSGGNCFNCGVTINQLTNTAVITMGLNSSPSSSGFQLLNLNNNPPTFSTPVPAANQISEDVLWDPTRKLRILPNEQGVILSPNESGVYDLFDISSSGMTLEFGNYVGGILDTAAEDCLSGIALATSEFASSIFLADLTQATFNPVSPAGTWTAGTEGAAQQFQDLPELAPQYEGDAPVSALAVAPGLHLAVVAGEFGDNRFGILQLPDNSGTGTPSLVDYAVATLPNTPDGQPWMQGLDPHTTTAYVSPNSGKAYALLGNLPNSSTPTWLAVVDMSALLAAPRVTDTHSVNPSYDLIANGVLRYVKTH